MKAWHFYVGAAVATGIGFFVIRAMTDKEPSASVGGTVYRAAAFLGDGGNWYAQVFEGSKPTEQLGPYPSEEDALGQAAAFIAGLDVAAFYTVRAFEVTPGKYDWFFDGWSRGVKISADNGPFASKAVAETAGSNWVTAQSAGAV